MPCGGKNTECSWTTKETWGFSGRPAETGDPHPHPGPAEARLASGREGRRGKELDSETL